MNDFLLSFDIEDWFHAHNLQQVVCPAEWDQCEFRVRENTEEILELLDESDTRATFFILGWVAERFPGLVKEIDDRGHEIASHGYNHQLLHEQTEEEIRADIERSINVLSGLTTQPISGYRAPSFSITNEALDILADLGFAYDSSSFPVAGHSRYGSISNDSTETFSELENGLIEAQLPKLDIFSKTIPWAGGGYFRFIPYPAYRRGVHRIAQRRDFIFYLHPWELDPGQPRFSSLPLSYRLRHYRNLDTTSSRLRRLLTDFDWKPIGDVM